MTQREIAARERVSLSTVSRWVRAKVDIQSPAAIRRHRDGIARQPASEETDDLRTARLRKLEAEADKSEMSLALLRGDYLPKAEVAAEQAAIGHVCNQLVRAVIAELPALLAGLSADQIEKVCRDWVAIWCDRLRDAQSNVWIAAREAVVAELAGDAKKTARRAFKKP